MNPASGNNILITGAPGVGKTTVVRQLVDRIDKLRCTGFYTQEIRAHGVRQGFELVGLGGQKALLAHVALGGSYRVGRYGVDVAGFDRFLDAIGFGYADAEVVFVDEIGKMETLSKKFLQLLDRIFASERQLVATISVRGPKAIQRFKRREDVIRFEVTRSNRNSLVDELAAMTDRR